MQGLCNVFVTAMLRDDDNTVIMARQKRKSVKNSFKFHSSSLNLDSEGHLT